MGTVEVGLIGSGDVVGDDAERAQHAEANEWNEKEKKKSRWRRRGGMELTFGFVVVGK
jgi:hypothetical protein